MLLRLWPGLVLLVAAALVLSYRLSLAVLVLLIGLIVYWRLGGRWW